jgi:protein-disulfide isomerase
VTDLLDPPLDADDHVDGAPDAPFELVMYGDFQCPFCVAAQPMVRRVREQLGDRLRFGFRHFPLTDVHPDAERAALAVEAAAAQGAFWPMHDAVYAARGRLALDDLVATAVRLGLDGARVRADVQAQAYADRVARDVASGEAAGVEGTPTFYVNGVRHHGAFDVNSLLRALEAGEPDPR